MCHYAEEAAEEEAFTCSNFGCMKRLLRWLNPALIVPWLAISPPTVSQMSPYLHAQRLIDIGGGG